MEKSLKWVKACAIGPCLEVAVDGNNVHIRESADPTKVTTTTREAWDVFLAGVKSGAFDQI